MTWPVVFIVTGFVATLALWATFVYIAVRGLKTEIPDAQFGALLDVRRPPNQLRMKILLPVDGSAASVAAVQEVARCPLPSGSTVECCTRSIRACRSSRTSRRGP